MIARVWRCIATEENAPRYVAHFEHAVLAELNALPGFKHGYLMRRALGSDIEITVMTLWESMDAIRGFAGNDPDVAVVAPAAQAVLKSFDKTVIHHEIVVDAPLNP